KIPDELQNFLIEGSRREDDNPRWMNHFYDPINNRGLTNAALGNWSSSKSWAEDSKEQNNVRYKTSTVLASILTAIQEQKISSITAETDFTWDRAVEFYAQGDKEKGLFILGHILHLIEDASVPDHTRNDAHPDGSPYESFAAKYTPQNNDADL